MKNLWLMVLALVLVTILSPFIFIFQLARKLVLKESLSEYFKTIAIGLDQVGGSLIYAQEDWTISSYTYYLGVVKGNEYAYWFMCVIDLLFGKNHCQDSFFIEKKELENAKVK
jgi:hypothetical protein